MDIMGTANPTNTRISMVANQVVTGALFGLAVIAFLVRCYIRFRVLRQFAIEDGILLVAFACLIAATAINYVNLLSIYNVLAAILFGSGDTLFQLLNDVEPSAKRTDAIVTLWWLVLYSVKLAYLFFFRKFIDRVPRMRIYWWCVICFLIPSAIVCFVMTYVACPASQTPDIIAKCSGSTLDDREVRVATTTTVFDCLSDVLVASFPLLILWKLRLRLSQKIALGTILCLSLVMAIVSIVRVAGVRLLSSNVDIVWLWFWLQQECSIAMIMVSVTAFRSLFVANAERAVEKATKPRYTGEYWRRRLLRKKRSEGNNSGNRLTEVEIPGGTLTGLRSAFGWAGKTGHSVILRSVDEELNDTEGV